MEDLHPVTGGVDEDKYVSVAKVHPHPVCDYATQAVESQTHIRWTVVEPVPVAIIKAKHRSQASVPEVGRVSYFPGCASPCRMLSPALLSGNLPLSVRHPSETSSCPSALTVAFPSQAG